MCARPGVSFQRRPSQSWAPPASLNAPAPYQPAESAAFGCLRLSPAGSPSPFKSNTQVQKCFFKRKKRKNLARRGCFVKCQRVEVAGVCVCVFYADMRCCDWQMSGRGGWIDRRTASYWTLSAPSLRRPATAPHATETRGCQPNTCRVCVCVCWDGCNKTTTRPESQTNAGGENFYMFNRKGFYDSNFIGSNLTAAPVFQVCIHFQCCLRVIAGTEAAGETKTTFSSTSREVKISLWASPSQNLARTFFFFLDAQCWRENLNGHQN